MANDEQEEAPDPLYDDAIDPQFDSHLEDEYGFDAHPMPGIETIGLTKRLQEHQERRAQSFYPEADPDQGAIELEEDQGSGSAAEDGRIEIGDHMEDELGAAATHAIMKAAHAIKTAPAHVAAKHVAAAHHAVAAAHAASSAGSGPYASHGPSEIGGSAAENGVSEYEIGAGHITPFESFMLEDVRLGAGAAADREGFELGAAAAADRHGFELGAAAAADRHGFELGAAAAADRHGFELGAASAADRDGFELGASAAEGGPTEIGDSYLEHQYEIGAAAAADRPGFEIGALAVAKVVEKARDNRQPAPPMKAVEVDAPPSFDDEDVFSLTDVILGAADQFPLLSKLLLRAGAGMEPRIVRVDTEESYRAFRAENSPEFAALQEKLEQHMTDPNAHDDLSDDIEDLVALGAAVDASEDEKRVELVMPKRFDGLVHAWKEGNCICASIALPGRDGEVRICTSLELISKSVDEMARHATESGVNPSAVLGAIPEMGCILGAGTAIKEMAAGAASILARPEASYDAPFVVRIEPKTSPNLAALMMLCTAARNGVVQAQTEWKLLGQASPGPLKQAMLEALQLAKAAA